VVSTTLLERLRLLRDLLPLEEGKKRPSWAALARATGVHRTHLGAVLTRAEKSPDASIEHGTAKKLVGPFRPATVDWLLTGDGVGPETGKMPDGPRYPNLEEAIREAKWSDSTSSDLRTFGFRSSFDFTVDAWTMLGNQLERARRAGKQIGQPLAEEDDTPPAGRG